MKTLVLGMGNTLLGDDGLGILITRYLENNLYSCNNLEFAETSWGGFRIIDLLRDYDNVIIVDTIHTGTQPAGSVNYLQPDELLHTLRLNSYHDINFITALTLGKELNFKMPDKIDIFAIEIDDSYTISESVSPSLIPSVKKCIESILLLLKNRNIISDNQTSFIQSGNITYSDIMKLYSYKNEKFNLQSVTN